MRRNPLAARATTKVGIEYIDERSDAIGLHVENIIEEQIY